MTPRKPNSNEAASIRLLLVHFDTSVLRFPVVRVPLISVAVRSCWALEPSPVSAFAASADGLVPHSSGTDLVATAPLT